MNLAALIPSPAPDRPAIVAAATVLRAPASEADTIDVQWVAPADETIGEELGTERAVKWVCRPGAAPAVDDPALLVLDSYGDPWAIVDASGASLSGVEARLAALEATRVVKGYVAADGSESSPDFSVVKNATGDYSVTFTVPFSGQPVVTPSAGITSLYLTKMFLSAPTASGFRVANYTIAASPANVDGAWSFVAEGPA